MNDALVSTPALQQALYIQQRAQAPVSRTESVELAALTLSRTKPKKPSVPLSAQAPLLDEQTRQQQVKCTAIKALLQLSPLLAEEASPSQAAADVLINCCLLPGGDVSPRQSEDLDEAESELRQHCLLALLAMSAQPQSMTSLLALSPATTGSSTVAVHDSQLANQSGHALVTWLDNVMLTGWQHKQVHLRLSIPPRHLEPTSKLA